MKNKHYMSLFLQKQRGTYSVFHCVSMGAGGSEGESRLSGSILKAANRVSVNKCCLKGENVSRKALATEHLVTEQIWSVLNCIKPDCLTKTFNWS